MLSDARSLWFSASNAIASLNENISTALENLQEDYESTAEGENNEVSLSSYNKVALLRDLDEYKKLLDDAQMQHVELSKQTGILLAEKEAEINYYKKINNTSTGSSDADKPNENTTLEYEKLLAEKLVIEKSLLEIEENLRIALRGKNELQILSKNYVDLQSRFDSIKSDFTQLKTDSEIKDKQKNETIENLVSEYSLLASECELSRIQNNKRVDEVMLENEILVTKIHALEHSITELADRASSSSNTSLGSSNSSEGVNQELRELRAKVVNYQFDLKEREDEILKLKKSIIEVSSSNVSSNTNNSTVDNQKVVLLEKECARYQSEILNLQQDVSRLVVEKKEAEEAGKTYMSQLKSLQKEKSLLESTNLQSQSDNNNSLQEDLKNYQIKCEDLEKESKSHNDRNKTLQSELDTCTITITDLRNNLKSLESKLTEGETKYNNAVSDFHKKLEESLVAGKGSTDELLQQKESELNIQIISLKTLLEAKTTEKEEIEKKYQQDISKLKDELTTASTSELEKLRTLLTTEFADKENIMVSNFKDEKVKLTEELNETFEKNKTNIINEINMTNEMNLKSTIDNLIAEKNLERNQAVAKINEEKTKEMDLAMTNLIEKYNIEISELKKGHEEKILLKEKELTTLQEMLTNVESRYKVITEEALAALTVQKNDEKVQAVTNLRNEMQAIVDKVSSERDEHLFNYTKERKLRKKLHNQIIDMQGNIRVVCRVRPILEVERKSGEDVDVTEIPNDEELLIQRDVHEKKTKYEYDKVFAPGSSQEEVFEAVQPLCISVLDGFNVCIFAYGQTGSGKTFTMEGYGTDIGVSPRAISELLKQVQQLQHEWDYALSFSMLEIYNESILDLLNTNAKEKLDIRQTAEGNQVVGLSEVAIHNMDQVRDLMKQGQANRAVGSHDMNEHSSRSHSILTIVCRGKNKVDGSSTYGKLHLIDLAGSERISKTDATGDRLKEAQNINKSLSALGDVVNALGNKKATHIPYRNSKLTFLLQDSLGGNSKVLTFVNISPAIYNLGETVCSLNFATRCRSTELGQAKKQISADTKKTSSTISSSSSLPSGASTDNLISSVPTPSKRSSIGPSSMLKK